MCATTWYFWKVQLTKITYDERLMAVVDGASWEQQLLPISSDDISVWDTSGTSCSGAGTGVAVSLQALSAPVIMGADVLLSKTSSTTVKPKPCDWIHCWDISIKTPMTPNLFINNCIFLESALPH